MNEVVDKQVTLHLLEYTDQTPKDSTLYVVYLLGLTELYKQQYMLTWIHLLLFAWLVINIGVGLLGWWFTWLPVLLMAFMAVLYRLLVRE